MDTRNILRSRGARQHLQEGRIGFAVGEGRLLLIEPRIVPRAICIDGALLVRLARHRRLLELLERRRRVGLGFGRLH